MSTSPPTGSNSSSLISATAACWALLLSIAVCSLSSGLQGTLLGLRANFEGFDTTTTGYVMSGYFVGFLFSSILTPRLVSRVGHVRVFAALASLASVSPLIHGMIIDPYIWFIGRIFTGFAFAGIYIISESWLNDRATNQTRGVLLSIYMIMNVGGMGGGPLLLNMSHPMALDLYVVCSVLISIALIPLLLAASPAPSFEEPEKLGLVKLYKLAPLGVVGMAVVGMTNGALISITAVYGDGIGMSIGEVSILVSLIFVGSVLLQFPIGILSDKLDRRVVIMAVTILAAVVAGVGAVFRIIDPLQTMILFCVLGGLALPMYSLCISHTHDRLTTKQMLAASSTLLLASGTGAIIGPPAATIAISNLGPTGYLWYFVITHGALGAYALYRMSVRGGTPLEEQENAAFAPHAGVVTPAFTADTILEIVENYEPEPQTENAVDSGTFHKNSDAQSGRKT